MWSHHVHALFDGYNLASYLDGYSMTPDPTITANGTTTVNLEFTLWKRQDKLIYNALLDVISISIQPLVFLASTVLDVWVTLSSTYAKPRRGHIKKLHQQLKQWNKGTKIINKYFQGLTTKFDQLALLGKMIDHEDKVDYVLQGLLEEYKPVIDQTEGCDVLPTLREAYQSRSWIVGLLSSLVLSHLSQSHKKLLPSSIEANSVPKSFLEQ